MLSISRLSWYHLTLSHCYGTFIWSMRAEHWRHDTYVYIGTHYESILGVLNFAYLRFTIYRARKSLLAHPSSYFPPCGFSSRHYMRSLLRTKREEKKIRIRMNRNKHHFQSQFRRNVYTARRKTSVFKTTEDHKTRWFIPSRVYFPFLLSHGKEII